MSNPQDDMAVSEEYKVEQIMGHRKRGKGWVYRVRWKGYNATDDTWATMQDLRNAPEMLQQYRQHIGLDRQY